MHRYNVLFSTGANLDLADIYDYIYGVLENPLGAEKIVSGIFKKCNELEYFPNRGNTWTTANGSIFRYVSHKKYTIFYTVNDTALAVDIFAIKYSRMDFDRALGSSVDNLL